jgi:hypothetical protein
MVWITAGLNVFGFSHEGALFFSALCGIFTITLFFAILRNWQSLVFSLLGLFCFSTNYYVLFYHRCFMSDGFALFFFCVELLFFICVFRLYRLLPGAPMKLAPIKKYRLPLLIFSGLLLGFTFTVRIQTCLVLFGFIGALGVAILLKLKTTPRRKIKKIILRYIYAVIIICIFSAIGYSAFMYSIKDSTNWDSTLEWYMKNVAASSGNKLPWKLYMADFLWKLCGFPFLAIALLGVIWEIKEFRKLNIIRLWLLVSFLGITVFYIVMGLPWPRAYLYYVFLLVFYWSFALERISGMHFFESRRKFKFLALGLLVAFTALAELRISWPLFSKTSNYRPATKFIFKDGCVNFSCAQSWPIFKSANILAKAHYISKVDYLTYDKMLLTLKANLQNIGIRYLILDHYTSHLQTNRELLQELVRINKPAVVYQNDFGNDYHACMDAFGIPPTNDEFSDKIMIFDIKELHPPQNCVNMKQ